MFERSKKGHCLLTDCQSAFRWREAQKVWVRSFANEYHRPSRQKLHALGVRQSPLADLEIFLQAEGDDQLSVREEPAEPAFPRRACAAALSERRGTLHRVQAVRSGVPGAGDYDRGRAARGRFAPHDALRHRYDSASIAASARKHARSMRW